MEVRRDLFFFDNGCSYLYPFVKKHRRIPRKDLPLSLQEFRTSSDNFFSESACPKDHLQTATLHIQRKKQNVDFLNLDSVIKVKKNEKRKKAKKFRHRSGTLSEFRFDYDEEDDGKFLFEESKYSAPSILAQLGRYLQVIWERTLYESDRWSSAIQESPELEFKRNINGFIWKFMLTDNFKKNVFILPGHIAKLVNVEYKDFVRNVNHKPREWQTQAYKDVVNFSDSALKRTDSGIFSVPPSRMSDLTSDTAVSKMDKRENVLNAKSSKDSGMTSESDGLTLLAYRRESRTPVHFLPPPTARHVRICIGKGSPRIAESSNQKINYLKNGRLEDTPDEGILQSQQETISFSLSSKNFHDKGWIANPSSFSEHGEKEMYAWARARLQQAIKKREQEELTDFNNYIYDDVRIHYYGDAKLKRSQKQRLMFVRNIDPSQKSPFMITLRDGSFTIFYPSGNVAVMSSLCKGSKAGSYTLVYGDKNEDNRILAHFIPPGRGVCYHRNGRISFISTLKSACCHDELGALVRKWKWTSQKLVPSFNLQLSSCMTFRCSLKENMMLFVNIDGESAKVRLGSPESTEEPKEITDGMKKTQTKVKKEERKLKLLENVFKATSKSQSNILSYQMELNMLHKKFKETVSKWMDHYRIAVGMKASRPQMVKRNTKLSQSASHLHHSRKTFSEKERAPSAPPNIRNKYIDRSYSYSSMASKQYSSCGLESDDSAICLTSPTKLPFRCGVLQPQGAVLPRKGCPVVLRLDVMGIKDSHCRCNRKKIPIITDIEFDEFIASLPKTQLIVVSTFKERCPNPFDSTLNQMHYDMNKNRSFPCVQASCDQYRLFRYPISSTDGQEDTSLLVARHKVIAGMFILYLGGKLLCADYMFDGYGYTKKDFLNHILKARQKAMEDKYLPNDFQFSPRDGQASPSKLLREYESGETMDSYNILSNVTSASDDVNSQMQRDISRTSDEMGNAVQDKSSPQLNVRFAESSQNQFDIKSQ